MGISAFLPIDDHASLLPFYLVASQGEFASSNFWLDTCHCATLLAIVVHFNFATLLHTCVLVGLCLLLQRLVRYAVIATNNLWHFVLSLAMLRLHFCLSDPYSDLCNLLLDTCSVATLSLGFSAFCRSSLCQLHVH